MTHIPIITVEHIGKTTGTDIILQDVSFRIYPHEFVSLKGPSGCGKTTLLRILAGLTRPDIGTITLNGKTANRPHVVLPPHERSMNMLFQNLALWPHMTGREQLEFVLESAIVPSVPARIDEVCQQIGLPAALLEKYPAQLSRGEQQRLAIARAVINRPRILLLDEPFTALDQNLRAHFVSFLRMLQKEQYTTILLVSHDLVMDMIKPDKEICYSDKTFQTVTT